MKFISFDDFIKIDLRVGTIIDAKTSTTSIKPAIRLWIDFGDNIGIKKSSAQITDLYTPENLIGKQIIAVTNFPPKQIGKFMSEVLVTGFSNKKDEIVLISPDTNVPNGQKLH